MSSRIFSKNEYVCHCEGISKGYTVSVNKMWVSSCDIQNLPKIFGNVQSYVKEA